MAASLWLCATRLAVGVGAEPDSGMGRVVMGQNADGRLEVFRVNSDGELQHRWQKEPNGDWSPWWGLGGALLPGIAVTRTAGGRLELLAVDKASRALVCIHQTSANGPGWSSWADLGGRVRAPVAVGQNREGRLEVFAVSADNHGVKHLWQTSDREGWSDWEDLGGSLEPGLVVGSNQEGLLELFGVEANGNTLQHCSQQGSPGAGHWSAWSSLGGSILPGLALGQNADGRLEVFAVNSRNGAVEHLYQVVSTNGLGWSAWRSLGGKFKPGIAVGQDQDGRLEVFGIPQGHTDMYHCWQLVPKNSEQWSQFWGIFGEVQPWPAVARNEDGSVELVAASSLNSASLEYKRQISANSDWLDWFKMDRPAFPYTARTWQTDEGLPHNLVQAIAQTPDGYLWVGTRGGLARFDGVHFTAFDARNTPELRTASITALCTDREGTLWIGTDGGGVVCLKDGAFTHYGTTNGLVGDSVRVIYERRDGSVWIGTLTGISRYKAKQFQTLRREQGLVSNVIRSIYEDRGTNLWIGTPAGLNCLQYKPGARMEAITRTNGLPENSIRGITQDKGNRLWIASDSGMIWHNVAGGFYAYDRRYGLADSTVSTVCEDREGNLWVGTYSGLSRFREGRFFSELNNEGVPYDKVNAIFEDRDGNLWLGSKEGLIRLTPKRFFTYNKRQGLSYNNTVSVLEDHTGSLWIGTWGGGLNRLLEEQVTTYTATPNGLSHNAVLALCEGRDGSLWVGADYAGGLNRLKDGFFTRYTSQEGLLDAAVRVIHEDRAGTLWIGTSRGLSCLKGGTFTNYTVKEGLAGEAVRAICEDHAGRLWFGTEGGLSRWEAGQFVNYTTRQGLSDNTVLALYEDPRQTLWIGTGSGGLNRLSLAEGLESAAPGSAAALSRAPRLTAYTTQQGLWSDEVLEILEDDHGWLWMSCSKGVFRARKADFDALDQGRRGAVTSIAYGKADGIESTLCNGVAKPAGWKSREGKLWFATTKGLVVVDPNDVQVHEPPPPVYIEQVLADKASVAGKGSRVGATQARGPRPASVLTLPPGRGELEFHFTALSFQAPERNLFQYQLEGADPEWIHAGTRRVAYYNNIYPGHYRFRVRACNSDGVWNEEGAALELVLRPHVWQAGWFRAVAVVAAAGLVGGTVRYVTRRRLQRKLKQLEQQHAIERERARIAKDIHDELGSSLTRIMLLGQRAQEDLANPEELATHAQKIVSSARTTVQSMDEIVWAVDPKKDTLEALVGYINQFTAEYFDGTGIRCRLEMPVKLPAVLLPAEVRHDLFLVVKEAMSNVLKHAQATKVHVRITETAGRLEIVVEDNGKGFAVEGPEVGRGGNGLENMRKRMERLGGRLELTSAPGRGAQLRLTLQVKVRPSQWGEGRTFV